MKIGSTTRTWIYVLINIALTTKHNIVSIAGVGRGVWGLVGVIFYFSNLYVFKESS